MKVDYAQWVIRAGTFCKSLSQRAGGSARFDNGVALETPGDLVLTALERRIDQALPDSVSEFSEIFGGVDCWYDWKPSDGILSELRAIFPHQRILYGGPSHFLVIEYLAEWFDACQRWGNSVKRHGDGSSEKEHFIWTHALPFMPIRNGDYLAFDLSEHSADPAVLYLSHDSERSGPIASCFAEFLTRWERVCYVGPEIWLLEPFLERSGDRSFLNADRENAMRLRADGGR